MTTMARARVLDAVPPESLLTEPDALEGYSGDVFTRGPAPLAVFRPRDIGELAAGLRAAAADRLAIVPRGGGMSYTGGYVAPAPGALLVDTGRMTRILAVDPVDMTVTVEAGVTWAQLHAELAPRGLSTPVWGTLSGLKASIGGGASQNGLFWGAGRGTIAAHVLSFDVVLADGTAMATGNGFLRPFGPDLTGLFAADAGALGIKAHVTLPLVPAAQAVATASFAFADADAFVGATSAIARAQLASEAFGFDPFLASQRMKRESLTSDARALLATVRAQGSLMRGLKEGAKIAVAGRSFLDGAGWSLHLMCEGLTRAEADERVRRATALAVEHGGHAIEATIPTVLRANPFPPVNSMIGPAGERWLPVHGIVRHSRALAALRAVEGLWAANRAEMDRLEVGAGAMLLPVAQTGFLIEPVFYWPDALDPLHERSVEAPHLARLPRHAPNPAARALVERLRSEVIDLLGAHGAMHFQIGRAYPLAARSDPRGWAILQALKREVDPDGRMNPGALGL